MKIRGKVMGILLAGCLLLSSGCTQEVKNSFTAVDYVDSVIQSIYQGEHKEYEEIVGIDEAEAEEGYVSIHFKTNPNTEHGKLLMDSLILGLTEIEHSYNNRYLTVRVKEV